jgi:hypothetical protein
VRHRSRESARRGPLAATGWHARRARVNATSSPPADHCDRHILALRVGSWAMTRPSRRGGATEDGNRPLDRSRRASIMRSPPDARPPVARREAAQRRPLPVGAAGRAVRRARCGHAAGDRRLPAGGGRRSVREPVVRALGAPAQSGALAAGAGARRLRRAIPPQQPAAAGLLAVAGDRRGGWRGGRQGAAHAPRVPGRALSL